MGRGTARSAVEGAYRVRMAPPPCFACVAARSCPPDTILDRRGRSKAATPSPSPSATGRIGACAEPSPLLYALHALGPLQSRNPPPRRVDSPSRAAWRAAGLGGEELADLRQPGDGRSEHGWGGAGDPASPGCARLRARSGLRLADGRPCDRA